MDTIINLTNRVIRIYQKKDVNAMPSDEIEIRPVAEFPPAEAPVCVIPSHSKESHVPCYDLEVGVVHKVPVVQTFGYEGLVNLPEYQNGVYYIVEDEVADAAKMLGRNTADLLIPFDNVFAEDSAKTIGYFAFMQKLS